MEDHIEEMKVYSQSSYTETIDNGTLVHRSPPQRALVMTCAEAEVVRSQLDKTASHRRDSVDDVLL